MSSARFVTGTVLLHDVELKVCDRYNIAVLCGTPILYKAQYYAMFYNINRHSIVYMLFYKSSFIYSIMLELLCTLIHT